MGIFVGLLVAYTIVIVAFLGLSIGIAFLLHWLLPAVSLEMALLISVIAVGQSVVLFGRLMNTLPPPDIDDEDEGGPQIVILDREVALPRRRRKRT